MDKTLPLVFSDLKLVEKISKAEHSRRNAKPKILINRLTCVVFLFGLFLVSAFLIAFGPGITTSVLYNGELVGVVESKEVASLAVADAERQASDILGRSCAITDGISYRKGVTATNLDSGELTSLILDRVDGLQNVYILSVNGKAVGGTENRKDITDLLSSILEANMSPTATEASFDEEISISQKFIAKGSVPDLAEMTQALTTKDVYGAKLLNIKTVEQVKYVAPVNYAVQYVHDSSMYEGESTVLSEGSNGEMIVTEQQTILSGSKIDSVIKNATVISEPTPAVIMVGTLPRHTSKGYYIWPANGVLTSPFGYRDIGIGSSYHRGIDIGVSSDYNIYAADGGTVIYSGWYSDYGNLIEIRHDNGDVTGYAHNSENLVSVGDKVAQGDVIAVAGATGLADGDHCHFELWKSGVRVDPVTCLP